MAEISKIETGGVEYDIKDKVAREGADSMKADVTMLKVKVDEIEGIGGFNDDSVNYHTITKSTDADSVVLGTWYPEDAYFEPLFRNESTFKINKIAGCVAIYETPGGSPYGRVHYIKSAFYNGVKLFELPDELIEQLDGYGAASGLDDNYILFGDTGIYYVQNCRFVERDYDQDNGYKQGNYLERLKKSIITDITEYVDFDGFVQYNVPQTESAGTMEFEVGGYRPDGEEGSDFYIFEEKLYIEIVGVKY